MLWCYWETNIALTGRINYGFIVMCKRKISTNSIQRYNGFKLAVKINKVKHKIGLSVIADSSKDQFLFKGSISKM